MNFFIEKCWGKLHFFFRLELVLCVDIKSIRLDDLDSSVYLLEKLMSGRSVRTDWSLPDKIRLRWREVTSRIDVMLILYQSTYYNFLANFLLHRNSA